MKVITYFRKPLYAVFYKILLYIFEYVIFMKGSNLKLIGLLFIFICFVTPAFAAELTQGNDMSIGDHSAIDANIPIDVPVDNDISIDDKTPADIPADGASIDDVPIDDGMPIDDSTPIDDKGSHNDNNSDGSFIIIVDNVSDDSSIDYQNSDCIDPTFHINDTSMDDDSLNGKLIDEKVKDDDSNDKIQEVGNIMDNIKNDSFDSDSSRNTDSIEGFSSIIEELGLNETADNINDMEDDDAFPFDYFDDNALSGFNLECLRNMVGIEEEWDEKVFKQNNKIFEPCKELDLKDLSLSTIEEGNKKEDVSSLKIGTIKTYDGLSSVCLNHAIFVYSAAVVEGYGNDVIDAYNNTSVNDIIPVCFYGENKLDEYVKTGIVTVKES